jgi:hypothetical protein
MAHPTSISSASSVTWVLQQSEEWGDMWARPIFDIIRRYDDKLAGKIEGDLTDDDSDDEEVEPPLKRRA